MVSSCVADLVAKASVFTGYPALPRENTPPAFAAGQTLREVGPTESAQLLAYLHAVAFTSEVTSSNRQRLFELDRSKGLGLQPLAHPSGHEFVGSEACSDCHSSAYEKWLKTPHAHATDSIRQPVERAEIPRHYDPECLSCHVTGWNPQEFFPYHSGYGSWDASPKLRGNGCENCHGPGSAHVAAENGDTSVTEEERQKLQLEMHVDRTAQNCMTCHDLDNSPDFHVEGAFESYWKAIAHGKD